MNRRAVVAALLGLAVLAPVAQAGEVQLTTPIAQRYGDVGGEEFGYVGPPTTERSGTVGPLQTSSDAYSCPGTAENGNTRALVVPDEPGSVDLGMGTTTPGPTDHSHRFTVTVRSWSLDRIFYRVVASCSVRPDLFPPARVECLSADGLSCHRAVFGHWASDWASTLRACCYKRQTEDADYSELLQNAFCWKSGWPGCPGRSRRAAGAAAEPRPAPTVAARPGGNRFLLRNGANRIALRFFARGPQRPPSVLMSGGTGCRAQRMGLSVMNGAGELLLTLSCRGLERGGTVRLTLGRPITRSFRLGAGTGKLHVRLDRPPGTVKPYVLVTDGRAGSQCRSLGHRLRLAPRSLDLTMTVRCGQRARGATGTLYVGGLLAR